MLCHWAAWGLRARPPRAPAVSACTRVCREGSRTLISCRSSRSGSALTEPELHRPARLRCDHRRAGRGSRLLLPQGRRRGAAVHLRHAAQRARLRQPSPSWWPIPLLALSGLLVAPDDPLPARERRDTSRPRASRPAGESSRSSFRASSSPRSRRSASGVVLGPEAPLIAIGSGMGVLAVHLIKRDAPAAWRAS